MSPNFPLLHQVFNTIVENLGRYDQSTWRRPTGNECGTAQCFAGWTAEVTGAEWTSNQAGSTDFHKVEIGDGEAVYVDEYAAGVLGLNMEEMEELFSGGNTLDDIREYIDHLHDVYDAPAPDTLSESVIYTSATTFG